MGAVIFSACVMFAAWMSFANGYMDFGSAAIISVLMYLWQALCIIHKTLLEIRDKDYNVEPTRNPKGARY